MYALHIFKYSKTGKLSIWSTPFFLNKRSWCLTKDRVGDYINDINIYLSHQGYPDSANIKMQTIMCWWWMYQLSMISWWWIRSALWDGGGRRPLIFFRGVLTRGSSSHSSPGLWGILVSMTFLDAESRDQLLQISRWEHSSFSLREMISSSFFCLVCIEVFPEVCRILITTCFYYTHLYQFIPF